MPDPVHPETVANVADSEITPDMAWAGALVIDGDPFCDLGLGYSEDLARRVISAALKARLRESPRAA